jgi:hypothetical protein
MGYGLWEKITENCFSEKNIKNTFGLLSALTSLRVAATNSHP